MKKLVQFIAGVLIVLALFLSAWVFLFGLSSPCETAQILLEQNLQEEKPKARDAVLKSLEDMHGVQCMAVAMRLRFGDNSFIKIVPVK